MSLPLSATTEQVEATRAWVRDFYNGIKSLDVQNWVTKFFQPDAILDVANLPPLKGHKAISDNYEKEREHVSIEKHNIIHVDVFVDRIYVQKKVTYIVKNDPEQTEIYIKSVVIIWKKVDEDKLSSVDIYLDPTSLTERIKMYS